MESGVGVAKIGSMGKEAPPSRMSCDRAGKWPWQQEKGTYHVHDQGQGRDYQEEGLQHSKLHRSEDKAWQVSGSFVSEGSVVDLGRAVSEAG